MSKKYRFRGERSAQLQKRIQVLPVMAIILVAAAVVIYFSFLREESPSQVIENIGKNELQIPQAEEKRKIYNYTPGRRPDYGLPSDTFKNLPPIPEDFWEIDEKFYAGAITDFVDMDERYWKQPEFYPTFENNLDFIKAPQGSTIYAYGAGAYPGDIGAEAPPDSQFTIATFFYSSWIIETYQGVKLEVVYPEQAGVLTPDLQRINFTVKQDPSKVGRYFNVTIDPEIFVLGPTAPVFDKNWALKIKINVTISKDTPKGTYVIGVDIVVPPPEYGEAWVKKYPKYSDASGFRVGRPPFQLVVFVT